MKITVPTSWADVTVKQFIELSEVPKLGFDDMDSKLKILSILTGVDDEYFLNIKTSDLKVLIAKTNFVHTNPANLHIRQKVMINGRRYRINYLPSELLAGEYIDMTNLTKDKDKINENLPKICAIYLKPVNVFGFKKRKCYKKVDSKLVQTLESREWTEKYIPDQLTMDIVFPMSAFFLKLWEGLTKATLLYSEREITKQRMKAEKILLKAGALPRHGVGI
jgi:hypothetical protein